MKDYRFTNRLYEPKIEDANIKLSTSADGNIINRTRNVKRIKGNIMGDICGDNRFEIIDKAKEDILKSTNISSSENEMKVLDSFLFRCWQMGWLDRYDE